MKSNKLILGSSTLILINLILCLEVSHAYRFPCIESGRCQCDTEEELIDCHNLKLRHFPRVDSRLRGYAILSCLDNDIAGPLPNEEYLQRMLPDLKMIDLNGNSEVNCTEIEKKFRKILILSKCLDQELQPPKRTEIVEGPADSIPSRKKPCSTLWCKLEEAIGPRLLQVYAELLNTWQKAAVKVSDTLRKIETLWNVLTLDDK